jgi:prevent-host-death family protein
MPRVGVRELKNDTSEVIRRVREERAEYVVTLHGRPVAVILPVDPRLADEGTDRILEASRGQEDFWSRMEALRAEVNAKWRSSDGAEEAVADQRR